jgi:alpha-mannosidase
MAGYTMHVISHTHWDREWYLTFQQFRMRLVDLVDNLLNLLDRDADFKYFNFDGQTIVLEDYLAIKPQNEGKLRKYIQNGRILVGPWYQLNDEFLVSGESTIRSLLIGHLIAEEFGAVTKVGYLPDQFGNISQMPQIFRGFGIDNCIFGRGLQLVDGRKTEFLWESPDGSQVLTILMAFWYNNTQRFPEDPKAALEMANRAKNQLVPHVTTPHLLFMNGVDHLEAQDNLSGILKSIQKQLNEDQIIHSTLPQYVQAIKETHGELATFKGEMREDRHCQILAGTLSSRMYIKQENEKSQTLLEKYAEPASVMAWVLGKEYPQEYLRYAWKLLMQNHPHDSICGCSTDQVHAEMMPRFAQVQQIGEELTNRALDFVVSEVQTTEEANLFVFNPLNHDRSEVVESTVEFPLGPATRSSVHPIIEQAKGADVLSIEVVDDEGKIVPYQIVNTEIITKQILSPIELPLAQNFRRYDLLVSAQEIPSCGYKIFGARPSNKRPISGSLSLEPNVLENEHLRVEIQPNGSLRVKDKNTGRTFVNCNVFEDVGDVGDEYRYVKPLHDKVYTTLNSSPSASRILDGPLCTKYRITYDFAIPESSAENDRTRSDALTACQIVTDVQLRKNSPIVEFTTTVNNTARDHRLRVLFPSGKAPLSPSLLKDRGDISHAEGQFDVLTRPIRPPADWVNASPFYPQQSWVDVNDGQAGLTVINKGLPEYELYDDAQRTLALTLLRCVGRLSGGGESPAAQKTPGAQCLGTYTFRYAMYPHAGKWEDAKVWKAAHRHNVPVQVIQTARHDGDLPGHLSFMRIEPANLVLSAIKKSERADSIIIRFYNTTNESVEGKVSFPGEAKEVNLVNLNEEFQRQLATSTNVVKFPVAPKQIVTLEVKREM